MSSDSPVAARLGKRRREASPAEDDLIFSPRRRYVEPILPTFSAARQSSTQQASQSPAVQISVDVSALELQQQSSTGRQLLQERDANASSHDFSMNRSAVHLRRSDSMSNSHFASLESRTLERSNSENLQGAPADFQHPSSPLSFRAWADDAEHPQSSIKATPGRSSRPELHGLLPPANAPTSPPPRRQVSPPLLSPAFLRRRRPSQDSASLPSISHQSSGPSGGSNTSGLRGVSTLRNTPSTSYTSVHSPLPPLSQASSIRDHSITTSRIPTSSSTPHLGLPLNQHNPVQPTQHSRILPSQDVSSPLSHSAISMGLLAAAPAPLAEDDVHFKALLAVADSLTALENQPLMDTFTSQIHASEGLDAYIRLGMWLVSQLRAKQQAKSCNCGEAVDKTRLFLECKHRTCRLCFETSGMCCGINQETVLCYFAAKDTCPVCFEDNTTLSVFKCGHVTCKSCWDAIEKTQERNCPFCRVSLGSGPVAEYSQS